MPVGRAAPAPELRGILLTLAAMGFFGTMDGLSKTLVQHYPAPFVLWLRHIAAVPLVFLVMRPPGGLAALRTGAPLLQSARVTILIVEMVMVVIAFRTMPLADVHAILSVTPLLVTALSVPLLGERVGWRRWAAVGAGFLGVLVILRPGLGVMQPMALLVLLCTLLYALYNILTRKVAGIDGTETSFLWQIVGGAVLLTLVGPFLWITPAPAHLPLFLGMAVLGAIGHWCLVRALTLAPAVVVQPFTYTLLIWAVVIGFLVFGDVPDRWTVIGAAIVVAAGSYTAIREHRQRSARAMRSREGG